MEKVLFQGAEATIILDKNKILKKRIEKSYRLKELDEKIRKLRTRSKTKLLEKASKVIPIPKVIDSNEKTKEISMDFIEGKKLSDNLDNFSNKEQYEITKKIGINISKIHDEGIIHGDLTTSNMILKDKEVYFIDFGLGYFSTKIEDKAVDLYLLKQALEAKHFKDWEKLFKKVISGYSNSKSSKEVLERLKKVESRGRYKEKY